MAESCSDKYAVLNGFKGRIECRATCTPAEFGKSLKDAKTGLVIMDVEGYEDILLAGDNVALLAQLSSHRQKSMISEWSNSVKN